METQDKKRNILKAASACFARYGYEKTTLDDIGKLVGLNKASLYYYYKNKEEIYTEVIYSETEDFMKTVFIEVDKVTGCKEKILAYLTERLKYIKDAMNLKQLSMDSLNKIAPLFNAMCERIIAGEIEYLSRTLECCINKEEVKPHDTGRVAKSIITVAEAIRNRIDCQLSTDKAYHEIIDESRFSVSLILDGLIAK